MSQTSLELLPVVLLLDRSGSMGSIRDKTIEGVNRYMSDLKEKQVSDGLLVKFSLITFDDQSRDTVYDQGDLMSLLPLSYETFVPRGMTPLHDAVVATLKQYRDLQGKRLFVIMTDGYENASKKYQDAREVQTKVAKARDGGWEFIYLGANQDAWGVAQSIGVPVGNAVNYRGDRFHLACSGLTSMTTAYRSAVVGQSMNLRDDAGVDEDVLTAAGGDNE